MADKIEDGGHAFPNPVSSLMREHRREAHRFTHDIETEGGMSLRDWFAGQALAGLCSAADLAGTWQAPDDETTAIKAYRIADHMLIEREGRS